MGYEMQLNDPVFYDDTWYVECDVCEVEYDRNTYDSSTCEECENKQVEKEKAMSNFEIWLQAQRQKGAYLEDAPADGYTSEGESQ